MNKLSKAMEIYKREGEPGYLVKVRVPVEEIREIEYHFSVYSLACSVVEDILKVEALDTNSLRDIIFILGMHNIL